MSEECLQLPAMYAHLHKSKSSSSVLIKPILIGKQLLLLRGDKRRTGERVLNEASKKAFQVMQAIKTSHVDT